MENSNENPPRLLTKLNHWFRKAIGLRPLGPVYPLLPPPYTPVATDDAPLTKDVWYKALERLTLSLIPPHRDDIDYYLYIPTRNIEWEQWEREQKYLIEVNERLCIVENYLMFSLETSRSQGISIDIVIRNLTDEQKRCLWRFVQRSILFRSSALTPLY